MAVTKKTKSASPALYTGTLNFWSRILIVFGVFVIMMSLSAVLSSAAGSLAAPHSRSYYLWTSVIQNVVGFAGTALVSALILSRRPGEMLGINRTGSWVSVGGIMLVFCVGLPFLNQVVFWNQHIHLPESMAWMEETMRQWEDRAVAVSDTILQGTSYQALVVNVLILGVLTGICEELLFRGCIQRVLASSALKAHGAIWVGAVIFSLMHFQFFGFLPRVLLGALFGYLFYWTGSIWIAATAHALNNSLVVFFTWLANNQIPAPGIDSVGVAESGFPAVACISLCLVVFVLFRLRTPLFKTKKHG